MQEQRVNGVLFFPKKIAIDLRRMISCSPWPEISFCNNFFPTNGEQALTDDTLTK